MAVNIAEAVSWYNRAARSENEGARTYLVKNFPMGVIVGAAGALYCCGRER